MRVILKVRNFVYFICEKLPVLRLFTDANGKVQRKSLSNTCILSTLYVFSWMKKLNDSFPQFKYDFLFCWDRFHVKSWAHVLEFENFLIFFVLCLKWKHFKTEWCSKNMVESMSSSRFLTAHDHSDKLLVVDVTLRVLLVLEQLLDLIIGQLLSERGQQVPQLGRRDEPAGVLVEVAQPLDKVIRSVRRTLLRDGLVDRQEHLERDALVRLQLHRELLHVRLGRVLAEGAQALADLLLLDLAIAAVVEQVERLLEFSQLIFGEISHCDEC